MNLRKSLTYEKLRMSMR